MEEEHGDVDNFILSLQQCRSTLNKVNSKGKQNNQRLLFHHIETRERLMDPNADLTDSEIRLGKGEQVKVGKHHSSIVP